MAGDLPLFFLLNLRRAIKMNGEAGLSKKTKTYRFQIESEEASFFMMTFWNCVCQSTIAKTEKGVELFLEKVE